MTEKTNKTKKSSKTTEITDQMIFSILKEARSFGLFLAMDGGTVPLSRERLLKHLSAPNAKQFKKTVYTLLDALIEAKIIQYYSR